MDATGNLAALGSSDTADTVYGLIVRSYPTTSATNDLGQAVPPRHYWCAGTWLHDSEMQCWYNEERGAVYVRIGAAATGKPIGGIEAVADGTPNTIAVKGRFMHDADASGNVEIAYNI